jgi:tRNA pseudouridine38/39 synthase
LAKAVAEVDPVMNGLAAEGEVVAEVVGVTATGTPVSTTVTVVPSKKKQQRVGDSEGSFDRHPRRHVALLFVYQGWHYSGLAIQQMKTPLPTVEGELLKALEKTHLIEEGKGWDGCDLSRCGRTDRGVSSAGQVVTLWMKSKRRQGDGGLPLNVGGDWREAKNPVVKKENPVSPDGEDESTESWKEKVARRIAGQPTTYSEEELSKMNARQRQKALKRLQEGQTPSSTSVTEFSYPQILNRVLPPEIRILAWSPLPWSADDPPADPERPDQPPVDARFSCTTRHYKYFFTRRPIPDHPPLDIERMREAASLLVGEHDFRNFCKVDGSKQIDNHARRVDMAVIRKDGRTEMADDYNPETSEEESEGEGEEYVFELIGSAFLWHQVRHIMSVLFHVGHGFESPSIVSRLLHTGYPTPAALASGTVTLEEGQLRVNDPSAVGAKPQYNMGAALPLQLYQCGYPEGLIDWRYEGFDGPVDKVRTTDQEVRTKAGEGSGTVLNFLKSQVEEARVKARQIEAFYNESVRINRPEGLGGDSKVITEGETGTSYTLGAGENYSGRKYVPFLERPRGDPVELQNKRWREGKGENRRLRKLAEKEEAGPEGDKEK